MKFLRECLGTKNHTQQPSNFRVKTSVFHTWKNGLRELATHPKLDFTSILMLFFMYAFVNPLLEESIGNTFWSGWWFGTFFIFHNIWDSPSHWLSYFSEGLKPPTSKGCPDLRGSCASTPRRLWRWIFGSSSQIGSLNSLRCCYWAVKEKMNGKTCFVTSVRWSVINFQKIINYCLAEELDEIW